MSVPFVESVWTSGASQVGVVRTFPTGHASLVVSIPRDGSDASVLLSGPTTRPQEHPAPMDADVVGLRLHPWALGAIAGPATPEVRDRSVALADVLSASVDWPQRWAGRRPSVIVNEILSALRLLPETDRASVTRFAVHSITTTNISLSAVAAHVGVGVRQLERIVAAESGLTPTQIRVARRLERAAELLAAGSRAAAVAYDAGFADQAHLTRSFRQLVGMTPAAFADAACPERDVGIVQDVSGESA